ncbi:MAG: universal stress protein [Ktedonobacteraceae bacterium]|nr:universal stress protein [Ktedonobacteraceae bacterium]
MMQPYHFLVPLDGSRLAESVLPTVERLAGACSARVTLLHIVEQHPPTSVHGEHHLATGAEARGYLEEVATRLRSTGLAVETHVHEDGEDDVAKGIVEHAREPGISMVIMCTHGHGGLRDWLFGSIAQQALQRGTPSILLVFPREDGSAPAFEPRRVLVPLDGTAEHEPALPVALDLARIFGACLHLIFVVPTVATLSDEQAASGLLLPATMKAVLNLAQQGAQEYLEQIARQSQQSGVTATAEVLRGDAVSALLAEAERLNIDLVVMASHGHAGLSAQLKKSVAPRMTGRVHRPLLLVRAVCEAGH